MGYAKGYVPGYGVKHTLHYSFVFVFYEWTFHHTLGPGYREHTLWRRVHTLIPGYIPGYGTSKAGGVGVMLASGASGEPEDRPPVPLFTETKKQSRAGSDSGSP